MRLISAQPSVRPAATLFCALAGAAVLAGCASTTPPPKPLGAAGGASSAPAAAAGPTVFAAQAGLTPAQRGQRAVTLLLEGQLGLARAEVDALLADAPQDPLGRSLYRQMNEDPRKLLGGAATTHALQPGETLPDLAERDLGDRNLFWALARYNGVPVPNGVRPGQVLQIPHAAPARRATTAPSRHGTAPPEHAAPSARPAAAPVRDPARAGRLRGVALEALSRGQADRAVALLQQALQADPDNAAVKRDLDRAERIRTQLHGRR